MVANFPRNLAKQNIYILYWSAGFLLAQKQLICPGPLYWPRWADLPPRLTWRKTSWFVPVCLHGARAADCPSPLYWPWSADLPLLAYMAQEKLICSGLLTVHGARSDDLYRSVSLAQDQMVRHLAYCTVYISQDQLICSGLLPCRKISWFFAHLELPEYQLILLLDSR